MSTQNTRIFQCFKAGTQKSMTGMVKEWTMADLDGMVANYKHRKPGETAPLVLGHPTHDAPAYGEVKDLFQKNGVLYAVAEVADSLIKLVREKAYNNVSISLRESGLGGWALRHIGFLGAMAPAVKDLEPLKFCEFSAAAGTLCFAGPTGHLSGLLDRFVIPRGWDVAPDRLAVYDRATEIQADCPQLQFSEAVMLAEKYIF